MKVSGLESVKLVLTNSDVPTEISKERRKHVIPVVRYFFAFMGFVFLSYFC
jgi:hypothetical protein